MPTIEALPLSTLFERDETAWLEIMSGFAAEGLSSELDLPNLGVYLADMAKRDRREVDSRLVVLLAHLLKWEYQPDHRSGSWRGTIEAQRRELRKLLDSTTLCNHAAEEYAEAYADARKQAAAETMLPRETFPVECPWDFESLLAEAHDVSEHSSESDGV